MTRVPPISAPSSSILRPRREPFLSAEVHVVTPMFGGGAQPGESDADYPVRGSTVRGHLRFWWRACAGAGVASVGELFGVEAQVWGQAAGNLGDRRAPSSVDVTVEIIDPGREVRPERTQDGRLRLRRDYPNYVTFPFEGQEGRDGRAPSPPRTAREGLVFRLRFTRAAHVGADREPGLQREVERALWAWVNFGGLGARTRRGCGALFCPALAPGRDLTAWLAQSAEQHLAQTGRTLPLPVLSGAQVVFGKREGPPIQAWRFVVGWLQEFRRGPAPQAAARGGLATDPKSPAYWPDARAIREVLAGPSRSLQGLESLAPLLPRADLGLPIVFQKMMRPDPTLGTDQDGASRFASPIIVKPLAITRERAVPLVIVLNTPHLWEIESEQRDRVPGARRVGLQIRQGDRGREVAVPGSWHDARRNTEVLALQGHQTAREAFLAHVRKQGNVTEVTL